MQEESDRRQGDVAKGYHLSVIEDPGDTTCSPGCAIPASIALVLKEAIPRGTGEQVPRFSLLLLITGHEFTTSL